MSKKTKQIKEERDKLLAKHRKVLKILDDYSYKGGSKEECFDKIYEIMYITPM